MCCRLQCSWYFVCEAWKLYWWKWFCEVIVMVDSFVLREFLMHQTVLAQTIWYLPAIQEAAWCIFLNGFVLSEVQSFSWCDLFPNCLLEIFVWDFPIFVVIKVDKQLAYLGVWYWDSPPTKQSLQVFLSHVTPPSGVECFKPLFKSFPLHFHLIKDLLQPSNICKNLLCWFGVHWLSCIELLQRL